MTMRELIEVGLTAGRLARRRSETFHFDRGRLMGHGLTMGQIDEAENSIFRIERFIEDEIARVTRALGESVNAALTGACRGCGKDRQLDRGCLCQACRSGTQERS